MSLNIVFSNKTILLEINQSTWRVREKNAKIYFKLIAFWPSLSGQQFESHLAPRVGLEPTTLKLHVTQLFPTGMDYLIILLRIKRRRSRALDGVLT